MKTFSKDQLEELFEHIGSNTVPECEEHRYALRRALLNSQYFSKQKNAKTHQIRLFAPVMISGLVVFIFVLGSQTTFRQNGENFSAPTVASSAVLVSDITDPMNIQKDLIATFIDDRPILSAEIPGNTVPFSTVAMSMRVQ